MHQAWSDHLELIAAAFEIPLAAVNAYVRALGQTVFTLSSPLPTLPEARPSCWDLDYTQHYLWALLNGMPAFPGPAASHLN